MLVLDTHVWVWWTDSPRKLSTRARAAIEGADGVGVATISCYELARLVRRGRLGLAREVGAWIAQALVGVQPLPLSAEVALEAALLEGDPLPGDPADRIIYATAREHGARLVTKDRRLRDFDPRLTLW